MLGGGDPGDPFAAAHGVNVKPLIPVAGAPMALHVLRALRGSDRVGRVAYVGPTTPELDPLIDIRVTDHGSGIPSENLHRIFQPYFTTKKTGDEDRGFGLGLACAPLIAQDKTDLPAKPRSPDEIYSDLSLFGEVFVGRDFEEDLLRALQLGPI